MNVLEVESLTKVFGDFTAVDHISFTVPQGEIFGFLGPNGAGKSTTIKILTTILNPTSGEAKVCGYDIVREKDEVRRNIGIVFQDPSTDRFLTGKENLRYHAVMYHMPPKEIEERIDEVLDLLDLRGREDIPIKDCSAGIQRRFEVARGFLTHPRLLFLDEPTVGLDMQARKRLWSYINKLRKEEITILLTTHYIEEADYLCDRVGIIDHGKIVAIGTPKDLKNVAGSEVVRVEVADGQGTKFVDALREFDWITAIEFDGHELRLSVVGGERRIPHVLTVASQTGTSITSIELIKPSLEDAFLYYTGKTIREEEGSMQDLMRTRMRRRR
jgi:ABC-2 type transport system ATP-binding protein